MTTQPNYLKYLESAKQAEVAERLRQEGYLVEEGKPVGDLVFDLVATKHGQTTVYEFKSAGRRRFSREEFANLQQAAARAGYRFRTVVAVPPPRVNVEVDQLIENLFEHLADNIPSELDSLSSHTVVEGVNDLAVDSVHVSKEDIRVSGSANVDVRLQYGGGADGTSMSDAFPFRFNVTLKPDGHIESIDELTVDTTGFEE